MSGYSRIRAERSIELIERELADIMPAFDGEHDHEIEHFSGDPLHFRRGWIKKTIELARDAIWDLREALASEPMERPTEADSRPGCGSTH